MSARLPRSGLTNCIEGSQYLHTNHILLYKVVKVQARSHNVSNLCRRLFTDEGSSEASFPGVL
jgi:hypothetical protein